MSKRRGFRYKLTKEQIEEYRRWPVQRRLAWLYLGNKMRRHLPKKTIEIQELFRKGMI
jgi:hypothetical protein